MAYSTAWIIGSVKSLDLDVTISASPQNIAGSLYLYHPTGSLSLLQAWVDAATAAGLGSPAAVLTRDRKVKLSNGANFSVTWTDTELRDLLGFSQGNLTGASSYIADDVSPLLWSPAKPLVPELSPSDVTGISRPLAYFTMSPTDGSAFVFSHGTRIDQRYSVQHVPVARVLTAAGDGGEWATFFSECAAKGYQWYVYPSVTEDPGSTTAATLTGGLGPYVLVPDGRAPSWTYRRAQGRAYQARAPSDITINCRDAPEYA